MKKNIVLILVMILMFGIVSTAGAANKKTIAVVNFTNETNYRLFNIGDTIGNSLSTLLVNKSGIQVVERNKLKNIMTEQGLTASGLVNQSQTAVQLGKLLGAEYIVTGSLTYLDVEESSFEGYGIETTQLKISLESSIKMINVTTGVIEAANIYTASKTYQNETEHSVNLTSKTKRLANVLLRKFVSGLKFNDNNKQQQPKKVKVSFVSNPKGASIEIDGIYMGSTPANIPVKEGLHMIKISMGGYKSWQKKVMAYAGLKVKATLGKKEKVGDDSE